MKKHLLSSCVIGAFVCPTLALADINVGIDLSTTGPAAAIGIQSQNAISLWPKTLGGEKLNYIVLDDASDVSRAVKNVRKLTLEDKVDLVVGPNLTAAALAFLDVLKETETPMIALAASAAIVVPVDDPGRKWAFKMPQNDTLMAKVLVEDMLKKGYKNIAFIGYADSYGENWWNEFNKVADSKINVIARESYQRTDTTVVGQVMKLIAAKPDAILIAGAGTPAVLPARTLKERGYKGPIYQTHGIGTLEFLQVGGKSVEGTLFPTGPGVVAHTLPDDNPVKKVALDFTQKYEAKFGANTATQFAGDAYGAWMIADQAASRVIQKGIKPGTVEFRRALRDEIEQTKELTAPNGVFNITAKDHQGFDDRATVLGEIKDGKFQYAKK
ncbi:branched-chain amino acid ABC transporter substrate-binding protein [Pelistega indica]|uniref:Branched-chain amino acid ABC transporter substrate-binding protein n=1 Tax=Pelistega indica TaxID=1414851 RepID=V8G9R5_9BURK|nr:MULTISPECIES: ABC transporter substrate-binding protein [Pelistega]ETD72442.1 branched-chain amino acid ABC transporter substrate-binding protein [Pelistega indica]